jgi:hypothetical protein
MAAVVVNLQKIIAKRKQGMNICPGLQKFDKLFMFYVTINLLFLLKLAQILCQRKLSDSICCKNKTRPKYGTEKN